MAKVKSDMKNDGWLNLLSGLGRRQDKTRHNEVGVPHAMSEPELTAMWMGNGLARRIVTLLPDDALRNGITVSGDQDGVITQALDALDTTSVFARACHWARLYGGALVVVGVGDGKQLSTPLNKKALKPVQWLQVVPRQRISITEQDMNNDPTSPTYGSLMRFRVQRRVGGEYTVHRDRCLVFHGEDASDNSSFSDAYWGMSTLQAIWDSLSSYGSTVQGIAALMQEFSLGKYVLPNLGQLLAGNNSQAVYDRMEIINASKSVLNSVLLGEGESYTRETASITGVSEVLDRFQMDLSSQVGIPVSKLFGRTPAGLDSSGDADTQAYYDTVAAYQEKVLRAPYQRLTALVAAGLGVQNLDEVQLDFMPVWSPSAREALDMREKQAQIDQIYLQMGVLDAAEVRANRFENGGSLETHLDD